MKVEFTVLKRQFTKYQSEYEEAALRVLRSGWYIMGSELAEFEEQYASFQGMKHCVGVNSGLDALSLTVRALGIGDGDEVIVQANTFIATVLAISDNRATPIFVEPDEFFGLDVEKIEAAITPKTRAIMPVHLYGQPCNMLRIREIADKYGLYVIEDCAQAHGTTLNGKKIGTFGDAACFSFYPTKPVGAFGDAGAIVTDSDELNEKLRMLRNYGSREKYRHEMTGTNTRLDEIQAVLLKVSLSHAVEGNDERRRIAQKYMDGIKNPKVILPETRPGATHAYHIFPLLCSERDALQNYLAENGIHTQIHYPIPCHLSECYRDLGYKAGDFPLAQSYANMELSLPIYVGMQIEEVEYVISMINRF
ncbi:MAG: DegT/DnrJ/EryC1/StrS family aminotransferase [Clostridia bacterium]|nr:DegT/DnrJ/EryC1/StrS family aminotransferase [Clostridia bacterium]